MIDLAEMKGIAIDPDQATATAEAGVTWGELNDAAGAHGLAVTGGAVSATGIAGYTLGGGLGWLMAKYGLAADNLLAVELVTAEGDVLRAHATSHSDLFWALRGGGGNFGVATSFTYRLHPRLDGRGWAHRPSDRRCLRPAALLPRRGGGRVRRSDRVRGPRARAGRLRREARRTRRLPRRRRRGRGARPRALQDVGIAAGSRCRPHALSGDEHDPGRGLPGRVAQLLAVELHARPLRRVDRHRRRTLRVGPLADDGDPAGALPRRGDARRCHRDGRAAPRRGLEPAHPVRVDRPGRHGGEYRVEPRDVRGDATAFREPAAGSTTSATTRRRTPSARPTARTTSGCARSSGATTPRTSSTSTTTSRRSPESPGGLHGANRRPSLRASDRPIPGSRTSHHLEEAMG